MNIIFITGATASGKSQLLANALQYSRIALFDCLADGGVRWLAPNEQECDAVAVDHVHWRGNSRIVEDAAHWCKANGKPLILAEVMRSDLDSFADDFDSVAEFNLGPSTAVLKESMAAVPVAHWWAAIQRAQTAQAAQSFKAPPEVLDVKKVHDAGLARKKLDGRTREGRAARLAAKKHTS